MSKDDLSWRSMLGLLEIMDIENGMPLEKSVKLLLADRMQNPDLV